MNPGLLHLLRVLHVVGGAFWYGSSLMMTFFVGPSVASAGPGGGRVMAHLINVWKIHVWIGVASGATLVSGIWLYGWHSGDFSCGSGAGCGPAPWPPPRSSRWRSRGWRWAGRSDRPPGISRCCAADQLPGPSSSEAWCSGSSGVIAGSFPAMRALNAATVVSISAW